MLMATNLMPWRPSPCSDQPADVALGRHNQQNIAAPGELPRIPRAHFTSIALRSAAMPATVPCASLDAKEVMVKNARRASARASLVQGGRLFRCAESEQRSLAPSTKRVSSRGVVVMASAGASQQQGTAPAQVLQPQEGERELLKKLYRLNQAAKEHKLEEVGSAVGLAQAASSASSSSVNFQSATDTFDEYEDMQGVPLMDVKRQDPRSQDPNAFLKMPNFSSSDTQGPAANWAGRFSSGPASGRFNDAPNALDSTDPAWDDRIPVDASIDGHVDDIDNYGDGAAGMAGQQFNSTPALRQAASKMSEVAAAAKATGFAAARAYAQVAQSSSRVAQAAVEALSPHPDAGSPSKALTEWVALDDPSDNLRVVILVAGTAATASVRQATQGLVPFQGMRHARVSAAIQDEACRLFMQLMPIIVEATEQGRHVCLTGQGAGGSLAGVLALLCAHHGLHSSGFGAVVFDAPPCIGEDAPDEFYEKRAAEATLDEDVIEEILSRGLMSSIGMPSSGIKSVIVHPAGSAAAAAGAAKESFAATLARAVPGLGLPLTEAAAQGESLAHSTVSVLRRMTGKQITVFKPLGTVVALNL